VAPDRHVACVHVHVGYGHGVVHLSVVTVVDAVFRRHSLFASIRKYVVLVSSVKVPGMAPVSLLLCRTLWSPNDIILISETPSNKENVRCTF
jgi:hypothetical protein